MFRLVLFALLLSAPAPAAAELKLSGRAQVRYAAEELPGEFSLPRVRLKLAGKTKYLKKVALQVDFGTGEARLKDAFADLDFFGLTLRVGQFKKPFSRQKNTSSSRLAFVDRAATEQGFGSGRDLGFMVHNGQKKPIEYAFGIFNGHGENGIWNLSGVALPLAVARVGYNHGKVKGYDEVDFRGGGLRIGAALSAQQYFANSFGEKEARYLGADLIAKIAGAAFLAEVFQGGTIGADPSTGLHLQAGYLIKGKYQPALRFTQKNDSKSVTLGFSNYMKKHRFKCQTDLTRSLDAGADGVAFRTQVQFSF